MSQHPDQSFTTVARQAVLDAVDVCRSVAAQLDRVVALTKDDRSPVTVADFASQAVIVRRLRAELGPVPILGEEDPSTLRGADNPGLMEAVLTATRQVWPEATAEQVLDAIDGAAHDPTHDTRTMGYWTVDPIDGTKGFLAGRQYAVCLAWVEQGTPRLGVLGCPNLTTALDGPFDRADPAGTLLIGEHGHPTHWTTADLASSPLKPVTSPSSDEFPDPVLVACSVESGHSRVEDIRRVMDHAGLRFELCPADSQAKYGMVARGQAHAYLRIPRDPARKELVWDHAAGCIIAQSAKMVVSDLAGRPLDFAHGARLVDNYGVLCAHPAIHPRLVQALGELQLDRAGT